MNDPSAPGRQQDETEHWPPDAAREAAAHPMPGWGKTIWRGICGRCPRCNGSPIFDGYLKPHTVCPRCGAPFAEMPADDAPPYIAMLVVLHFVGLFVVFFFKGYYQPGILMAGVLVVLLVLLCMAVLRMAKGAVIGVLLKLGLKRERL